MPVLDVSRAAAWRGGIHHAAGPVAGGAAAAYHGRLTAGEGPVADEVGDARAAILALLAMRAPDATICPSEVARAIGAGGDWRAAMPIVHVAVDALAFDGSVRLSWKGAAMAARAGPYRIGRGPDR